MRTTVMMLTAALAAAAPARVEADADPVADALFREGKRLEATDIHAACAKYRASYERDRVVSSGLALASCLERDRRLASAYAQYSEVARLLARSAAGQAMGPDARQAILDTIAARRTGIEARISTLEVDVPVAARVDGLQITWLPPDAPGPQALDSAQWGVEVPVDGGPYVITVRAPGFRAWSTTLTVAAEQDRALIHIPRLELEAAAPTSTAEDDEGEAEDDEPAPAAARSGRGRRLLGLGLAGGGVVALGVGVTFGVIARGRWADARDAGCDDDGRCATDAGFDLATRARSAGNVGTIAVSVGAAALVAGVVVYLTAPRGGERTVALTPTVTPHGAGLALAGGF